MKVFIASSAALLLTVAVVIMSAIYVYRTMDFLDGCASDMPVSLNSSEGAEKAGRLVREVEEYWSGRSFGVSMSLSHKETEYIDLAIEGLRTAVDAGNSASYAEALSTFRHYVRMLREEERLSFENMM